MVSYHIYQRLFVRPVYRLRPIHTERVKVTCCPSWPRTWDNVPCHKLELTTNTPHVSLTSVSCGLVHGTHSLSVEHNYVFICHFHFFSVKLAECHAFVWASIYDFNNGFVPKNEVISIFHHDIAQIMWVDK